MVEKKLGGAGLRGQSAGETALCTVGKTGSGLTYRGYDIKILAERASFEEVAYLLLYGKLPNSGELASYCARLKQLREIPEPLRKVLELIPKSAHPMDVMRTGCSMLGNLETEESFSQQHDMIDRLLAIFPSIINYWYRFSHFGDSIQTKTEDESIAAHFLRTLTGKTPSDLHRQVMNVSLILYAEHEFNASTFTGRVCASTLSDIHSAITGAIGSLRGPLHGGANEAAMEMISEWSTVQAAESGIMKMLESMAKIMGFGHAIYRESDPRNEIIKGWAKKLAEEVGDNILYPVSEKVDEIMWREKKLFPNADFYHASAYHFMDIPTKLFTPIFVCSRVAGWAAHIMEQRSNNRIIRPSADYIGPETSDWINIEDRD